MNRGALVVVVAFALCHLCVAKETRPPVILVPGTGGSQLEAKLDKPSTVHWYCSKKSDWFHLWMSPKLLLPGAIDCWVDNMHLDFSSDDGFTNSPGVDVRVRDFGKCEGVEWEEKSLRLGYFHKMIEEFVKAGYTRNVDIRAAPYDFRYSGHTNSRYAEELRALVDEMVKQSGGQKVTLIAHSMGGLMTRHALTQLPQDWKDAKIARLVTLGSPFHGASGIMHIMAKGTSYGIPWLSGDAFRPSQRTYESNFWMLPRLGTETAKLTAVHTPSRSYTVDQMDEFFSALGYTDGSARRAAVQATAEGDMDAPGVPVHCVHGSGVKTAISWTFDDEELSNETTKEYGDGDGSVNTDSASACQSWRDHQSQPVSAHDYPGVGHSELVKDDTVIADLVKMVSGDPQGGESAAII